MKILLNYCYQYYPFTTASYLEMACKRRLDITSFRLGEQRTSCADLIINIEPCNFIVKAPSLASCFWEIDNHLHKGEDIEKYYMVDKLFITQKHFQACYPPEKTYILPLASDPSLHHLYQDEPILYDVGFLGNDTYFLRKELLDRIGKKYKLLRSTAKPGEEYSRKLSQCKILFNCSMDHDVNMRFFEAISIGRLLLTDKLKEQEEYAKDGKHFVSYDSWHDLDQKIEYYLSHDEERERIAKNGAEYIHATCNYDNRLNTILQDCGFY